jgi:hypothetical protein
MPQFIAPPLIIRYERPVRQNRWSAVHIVALPEKELGRFLGKKGAI